MIKGYSNYYSGNHVDVSKMTTEEKKAYYEEQRKRQEEYEAAQRIKKTHWAIGIGIVVIIVIAVIIVACVSFNNAAK